MGVSVKDFGDTPKVLFASRIPNLKLNQFVFHLDCKGIEFDTNRDLTLEEFVFCEPFEHTRFSARRIADRNDFKDIVILNICLPLVKNLYVLNFSDFTQMIGIIIVKN